eukprot:gnl/TRDRNA2_/TRDRNA2_35223_c0_seq1.p1 gnl/TRDRNA2_/TRDRNA2_35223_c0~~gnl/TRDRNA2_/TRDRNA2_35223_c0_seq1.p1  ORF type:complete len:530 (-),score=99.23 gnl/TRDRNA2_/TRDRNA2_35223_c0_seq1:598-2187(-)
MASKDNGDHEKDVEVHSRFERGVDRMVRRWAGVPGPKHLPRTEASSTEMTRETPTLVAQPSSSAPRQTISETRETPIHATCDVLVVGAGPAGLCAALGARRAGADVMILERFGCFGGVITTVGMETLAWYRYEGTQDCEGIGTEMERLAAQMGGSTKWPFNGSQCLDADFFKIVADHLIKDSGVRPMLHTFAVEAIMDGNKIKGVITESKSGRLAILADRVIDCTGDADVAHLAGAKYKKNVGADNMGVTSVFNAAGVDKEAFLKYTENHPRTYQDWSSGDWKMETTGKEDNLRSPLLDAEFRQAQEQGIISNVLPSGASLGGSWSALSEAGEATNLNLVHMGGIDCTNVDDLTRAEMEGRAQTLTALKALKALVPGFENAKLRNFGMTVGTRDSRKIVGKYNLTSEDVRNQARFDDAIGIFPEFIDGYAILVLPTTGRYFQIPYGCMQCPDVDNLLVAGRCVAGDKTSHAAMRNMMACCVTGQGAGVAAAMSIKQGKSTHDVDIAQVQGELRRQGVNLDGPKKPMSRL